jgi:hypothetical protein
MYPNLILGTILKMEFMHGTQNLLMTIVSPNGKNETVILNVNKDSP